MPLQRSPPSENTRTKTILKSSLLAAHRTDVSSSHPSRARDSLPALQMISAESTVPTNVLSWSAQCLTPQLSDSPALSPGWSASLVSTATSTTTTTTYCSAMATTTASTYSSTSTAVSVSASVASLKTLPSTTTTSNTSTAVSATASLASLQMLPSTTTTSSSEPAPTSTLAEKEKTKRNRSSPNKTAMVSNNKKQKITQPIKGRQYWLGESPKSSNKFALLDTIDIDKENINNSETTQNTVAPSKPPPIYVQGVERIGVLQKALSNINVLKYELQVLKNNEVKIVADNIDQYNTLIKFLNSKSTEYYTFKPKNLRGFNVVLRNMHYSTDLCEIKEELAELGHEVVHLQNMLHSHTKQPILFFFILSSS